MFILCCVYLFSLCLNCIQGVFKKVVQADILQYIKNRYTLMISIISGLHEQIIMAMALIIHKGMLTLCSMKMKYPGEAVLGILKYICLHNFFGHPVLPFRVEKTKTYIIRNQKTQNPTLQEMKDTW